MPRITTDSGKTLDDVLQADLFTHATVDYTDSDGVRHVEDVPVTRRGDSIVPPSHRLTLSRNRKLCTCDYDHFRGRHESICPYYVADLPPSKQPRVWIE